MFEGIIGNIGELRTDITTGTVYRYNGTEWIVNGTGTPSSDGFPTTNVVVGEVREDFKTGGKFRWSGSAWGAIVNNDPDGDGIPTTVEDGGITTSKLVNGAVTRVKTSIIVSEVTVSATETTGTVTVPAGSVVLGIVPVSNQDQLIDSVLVDTTTLTVTLASAATADNVFNVVTMV